jgi:TIR domain
MTGDVFDPGKSVGESPTRALNEGGTIRSMRTDGVAKCRVFCSYRSTDAAVVEPFATRLRTEAGIDAWLDVWDIAAGDDAVRRMDEGVRECDAALVFLSADYTSGRWALNEMWDILFRAVSDDIRVIPVLIGDVDLGPLPLAIQRRSNTRIEQFDSVANALLGLDPRPPLAGRAATRRTGRGDTSSP